MASNPPEPRVVTVLRDFKAQLLARETRQMQEMARRWRGVEDRLEAEITALADQVTQMRADGAIITEARLWRLERYQRLQAQTLREFERYAGTTTQDIMGMQRDLAALGIEQSTQAIQWSYWPRLGVGFERLPVEAVEAMIGLAGDGAPIGELLKLRMIRDAAGNVLPGVWDQLTRTLINGTALGWNPRKTARGMRDALTGGLQKALVIARTEQLRVYRQAAWDNYQKSGVVKAQRRLCAHDDRVCAACLADEGHIYLGPIPDHPSGRCTGVPVVEGMPAIRWTGGEDWFKQQSAATQRGIMGQGRWDAWRDGQFEFGALATRTSNATWGGGLAVTPLNQLMAG